MENIRVLMYPQVPEGEGGPSNVIKYLSFKLKKQVKVYGYPLFSVSSTNDGPITYAGQLGRIWGAILTKKYDVAHFLVTPWFLNASSLVPTFTWANDLPTIVNVHGITQMEQIYRESPQSDITLQVYKIISLMCCRNATRVVVNSKFMLQNVVEWYGVNRSKVALIPNGVDVKHFRDSIESLSLEGDPCILFVGRFSMVKGAGTLLKAIAIAKPDLPKIKVHFVGCKQPISPDMQSLINELGVDQNIVLHSWVSQSQIPSYYKSADFCVFASFIESFAIVILEAMAAGTPIIASDIAAYRELLSQGTTGLFFRTGDPEDLCRAILELSSDSNLKLRLSKNASKVVQTYDWENIAKKYVALYQSIIK
jgi:glycosyltransferase involved in cell wall biosynthesis